MAIPNEGDAVTGNVGRYVLGKFLTKGPSAFSHEAFDSSGKKMFLKGYISPVPASPIYEPYLRYEVELNSRLKNDHYLKQQSVYAVDVFSAPFERNGRKKPFPMLFQVFPFISGNMNLDDLLRDGIDGHPLTWEDRKMVANIFTFAMDRLHAVKVVHADLKPENVQISIVKTADGKRVFKPLLVDMDGSVLADRPAPWAAIDERTGEKFSGYLGTEGYFSPEHLRGKVPVLASDVFTAAIILCQLLAERHPFASSIEKGDGYKMAFVTGAHDFVRTAIPFKGEMGSDDMEKVIRAALNPDPDKRPTMAAVHEAVMNIGKKKALGSVGGAIGTLRPVGVATKTPGSVGVVTKTSGLVGGAAIRLVLTGAAGRFSTGEVTFSPNKNVLEKVIGADARYTGSTPQFVLVREAACWFIEPAAPKNPTFVNGTKLTARVKLLSGDCITIGSKIGLMRVSFV